MNIIEQAIVLRKEGNSYKVIGETLNIGTTTARRWTSSVELTEDQRRALRMIPAVRVSENCLQCGKKLTSDMRYKYCSRTCAQTGNRNRTRNPDNYCKCGNRKNSRSEQCISCRKECNRKERALKPINDFYVNSTYASVKYNSIRAYARAELALSDRPKQCEICGFNVVVQVCHLKGIAEFPDSALMGEVNALSNLKYLCPNHHAMLDKGLLDQGSLDS